MFGVVIICILSSSSLSASCTGVYLDQRTLASEIELSENFIHPNVTAWTEVDYIPFQPTHYLDNELDMKATEIPTCECGTPNQALQQGNREIPSVSETWVANGEEAQVNEFPWVVALVYHRELENGTHTWEHFCGGTLLNNKFILTATHCLFNMAVEKTEVWLNEHDILLSTETNGDTIRRKAIKFIPHPNYSRIMHYNDISLIELDEEVDITDSRLRPICLPKENETVQNSEGITAGWGQTSYTGPKSSRLLKVKVPIISNERCINGSVSYYKRRINEHSVCAGDLEKGGKDSCPGDSGGPLFTLNSKNRFQLLGIVSWGYRCGERNKPGVYTRVSKYKQWIENESRTGRRCKS